MSSIAPALNNDAQGERSRLHGRQRDTDRPAGARGRRAGKRTLHLSLVDPGCGRSRLQRNDQTRRRPLPRNAPMGARNAKARSGCWMPMRRRPLRCHGAAPAAGLWRRHEGKPGDADAPGRHRLAAAAQARLSGVRSLMSSRGGGGRGVHLLTRPQPLRPVYVASDAAACSGRGHHRRLSARFRRPTRLFAVPAGLMRAAPTCWANAAFWDSMTATQICDPSLLVSEGWVPETDTLERLTEVARLANATNQRAVRR